MDSTGNQLVVERFKNSNESYEDVIKFILTSGKPKGVLQCSRCKENLSVDEYRYYLSRVDKDGYLMRSNAICNQCSKIINKGRGDVLSKHKNIPKKPIAGSRCPNCKRAWSGNWHRHHSGDTFIEWLCSNCNMALQDQRNPNTKYG